MGYKTESNRRTHKGNKQKFIDRQQLGRGAGVLKAKGGIYGEGRRFDVGWWAHNAIYR